MTRMEIEILGTGCSKCKKMYQVVTDMVKEFGIDANVVKVEDIQTITDRGVMITPALFVNGEAMVMGRIPTKDEMKKILGV